MSDESVPPQADRPAGETVPTPWPMRWMAGATMVLGGLAALLLLFHSVGNALLRTFANSPLQGTTEYVASWYMPTIIFLGLVLAQQSREHIEASILFDRAPLKARYELQLLSHLLTLGVCAGFGWFGLLRALENMEIGLTGGVTGVTIWPVTFLMPIGFFLLAVQLGYEMVAVWRARQGRSPGATRLPFAIDG